MFLMTFAIVALVVGSFVIYNTFSITVAQRTKETALLRAIGAKRKQVTRSVMLEALFTGVVRLGDRRGRRHRDGAGSAARCSRPSASSCRRAGTVVQPRDASSSRWSPASSVTLVAAYLPARKAAKVAPIEALRDVAVDSSAASKRGPSFGTMLARRRCVGSWRQGLPVPAAGAGRSGCARRCSSASRCSVRSSPAVRPGRRLRRCPACGGWRARWPGRTRRATRGARRRRPRR